MSVNQSDEEERNWLQVPEDLLSMIFKKLGPVEVILTAQRVCSSWRALARDPHFWSSIEMRDMGDSMEEQPFLEKVAMNAVDKSVGQLIEFSVGHFGTDELLLYTSDRSSALGCLRLPHCALISDGGMIEAVKKLPLLEELDLSYCEFVCPEGVIEAIGQFCPRLNSFKLNRHSRIRHIDKHYDAEAVAIAENMAELRYLQIFRNNLTDDGVRAILDGCPHLEFLDLRQCSRVKLVGDLERRCADGVETLKLPNDPIKENEFYILFDSDDSDGSNASPGNSSSSSSPLIFDLDF